MSVLEKAVALLDVLRPADIQAMPPAERRRFADTLRHLAAVAERPQHKSGVLCDLARGVPRHE